MLFRRLFIVFVLCYPNISCSIELCNFEDSNCLTASVKRIKFTTNSLHLDVIEANLPTVKYTLTNTTLSGIESCVHELLKGFSDDIHTINPKDMKYDYHVACKHLAMDGLYEVDGKLGPMTIKGKGDFHVDYDDYVFLFNGDFEYFDKEHFLMKNFKLDIDARGKVMYNFRNLFNGDTEKAAALQKFVHENGETVNKIMRQPVMEKFMTLLIERVNKYLQKVSVEDIFTEH